MNKKQWYTFGVIFLVIGGFLKLTDVAIGHSYGIIGFILGWVGIGFLVAGYFEKGDKKK